MIRVDRDERRVWVFERRCHHGIAGIALATAGALIPGWPGPLLFAVGIALAWDDRHDVPWLPTRIAV